MKLNEIYNEDCLDTMAKMPDSFIDCIITDPPYSGLSSKSKTGSGRFDQSEHHIEYDDMSERAFLLFIKPIFREAYRVLKLGGHFYCFTDWKQLRNMADCIELASFKLVNIICWDKCHFGTGAGYRSQSEYILVFSKGLPNAFNLRNIGNVIQCKRQSRSVHPHQKPEMLLSTIIENSTKEDDIIYDPFGGSGTTAKMADVLDRKWIISEISSEYCDVITERIKKTSPVETREVTHK